MNDLADFWPPTPVDDRALERSPRLCNHPRRDRQGQTCGRCGHVLDEKRQRRGRQSRNYGNRAELAVARKYGGQKVGHAGGPVDVRGKDFNTQVKTHRRLPPGEWTKAFAKLEASRERIPRLLLRFVMGAGVAPQDYFVFRADDFLDWFGRDEETVSPAEKGVVE